MLKRLFVLPFFLLSALIFSPSGSAETDLVVSPEEKAVLEKNVDSITFALIDQDVDELMKLTRLNASFQFDKRYKLSELLSRYRGAGFAMTGVEIGQMKKTKTDEIKVMVKVHLSAGDALGGLGAAPRSEVWRFGNGFEEDREKWFLLVD